MLHWVAQIPPEGEIKGCLEVAAAFLRSQHGFLAPVHVDQDLDRLFFLTTPICDRREAVSYTHLTLPTVQEDHPAQ